MPSDLHLVAPDAKALTYVLVDGKEIDFVVRRRGRGRDAIECKWSADGFDEKNLKVFRRCYPSGRN